MDLHQMFLHKVTEHQSPLTAFGVSFSSFRNHSFLLKQLCFDQTAAFRTSTSPREAKNSFLSFKEIKFNTAPITWYFIVQKCFLRTWLSASCSVYGGYYSRLGWLYVAQILFLHAWIPPGEPSQHVPSLHSIKHSLIWRNGSISNKTLELIPRPVLDKCVGQFCIKATNNNNTAWCMIVIFTYVVIFVF